MESLTDLPPNILSDILSRLPIKSLLACRSVCKTLLHLTSSNPYFNSLHSSNAPQSLIIQFGNMYKPTRLIHLVDSELDTSFGFGKKVALKPMFQIPKYPSKYFPEFRLSSGDKNKFIVINSCNGLVLCAERSICERSFICNPITNEYVTLPEYDQKKGERQLTYGLWFGFSEAENQYKVLRFFSSATGTPLEIGFHREYCNQVHVVGSSLWRDIEEKPLSRSLAWDTCSIFLNGTVCWLCRYPETSKFIIFFDFEREKFGEIPPPFAFGIDQTMNRHSMNIGLLGGCLCVTDISQHYDIWAMKKFGVQESWTKVFTIDPATLHVSLQGPFRPLQMLRNGKMVILWNKDTLVCYDPKVKEFRFFAFYGVRSLGKMVLFTPSFVPLKEALMVDNLIVEKLTLSESD